jgi:thiol-disulfide isomerase/thioredoxin
MRIVGIALVSSLALGASDLRADDQAITSPIRQYQMVLDGFETAKRSFASKFEAATTDEQRRELRARSPRPEDYYGRLLALAEAHPADAAAVDALIWIVATSTNGYDAFKERGVRIKRAMDILGAVHVDDPRVGRVCLELATPAATPLRDEFLHTIYAKSTARQSKGRACLALGKFLVAKSETVARLRGPSGREVLRRVRAEAPHRLPYYEKLLGDDPEVLARQGEELLERAIAEYGELPFDPTLVSKAIKTLADVARADLRRLRNLAVGQRAPEIEGRDVDGKPFKLSEYRGRVVLLTFSGNWCGPCRAMYPEERALVERLKGRPFALLSVNTDQVRETLRRSIAQGEITWKCWWESGVEGPICTQWLIESYPQTYLLDHNAIIRSYEFPSNAASNRAIEELLQACEAENETSN